ncbi:PQQ-binding-like beta-propeller repeat protein [bacterium]|nr:PQQ-binding-like beta-propeller repeat protein [bacterium]NUN45773.1 PQQ-like beta-propeller repeat protein [bacterium]
MKRKRLRGLVIMLLAVALLIPGCDPKEHETKYEPQYCSDSLLSASDAMWSHGLGDLQNTKRATDIRTKGCVYRHLGPSAPYLPPTVKWKFEIGGPGTAAPPVIGDDGTIYLVAEKPGQADNGGYRDVGLFAINPNGTQKWYFSRPDSTLPGGAIMHGRSVALADDGTIYLTLFDRIIYALRKDGSIKWSKRKNAPAGPAVDVSHRAYFGSDTIWCYSGSGKLQWQYIPDEYIGYCTKIVLTPTMVICGFSDGILALSYTGKKKWFYPVDFFSPLHFSMVSDEEENIYFKTSSNNLRSIDRNGVLRWVGSVNNIGGMSDLALRGQYLYFGAFTSMFRLDKDTGTDPVTFGYVPLARYISENTAPLIDDAGTLYMPFPGAGISAYLAEGTETGPSFLINKHWDMHIPQGDGNLLESYLAMGRDGVLYIASWVHGSAGKTGYLYAIN